MPKSRPPYPPEYRRKIVELARAGRPIKQLAREFEPTENCIRNWVKQPISTTAGATTDSRPRSVRSSTSCAVRSASFARRRRS